jgi:hypothetical protein
MKWFCHYEQDGFRSVRYLRSCSNPTLPRNREATTISRKRRTVLWLFQEDYEYLSAVAESDSDSKNISMHRLVKALRQAGIKSFVHLQLHPQRPRKENLNDGG